MNEGDASPSFFDANQDSPDNQNPSDTTTPAVVNTGTTPVTGDTPIGGRCLFPDTSGAPANRNNRYLQRIHNQSLEIDEALVREDEEEEGDDDSNCFAKELDDLDISRSTYMERVEVLLNEGIEDNVVDSKSNCCLLVNELGERVSIAKPPDNWKPKAPKVEVGEPEFPEVDNPGGWSEFTFKPKFCVRKTTQVPKGHYMHHALPTGASPIPPGIITSAVMK